ncbi:hypothetical protein H3H36_15815 [Duganella sp. FT3S]|uniref:Uncharacterized protein n=1 Tax=Rugamonas fusca TaxID=2758568 RepID=A0A7W2EJA1_9BURK|nr:hypothetical protein [Rugamonas fusca]MBA5606822.1 hypothetical protein [Rugamonas fusca]
MKARAVLAAVAAALGLAGCATPIITQTNAFLNAGTTLTRTVETAQQNNLDQENGQRASMLAANYVVKPVGNPERPGDGTFPGFVEGDGQCDLKGRIYLRYVYTPERPAEPFLQGKPTLDLLKQSSAWSPRLAAQCGALLRCEQAPQSAHCNTTCYSADERACIDAISTMVAKEKDDAKRAAMQGLAMTVGVHAYPLQVPIEARASLDALVAFTGYLHLLQAAAVPQPGRLDQAMGRLGGDPTRSVADNASTLAQHVASLRTRYNNAQQKAPFLPTIGGVSDTRLTTQLGALGQLLSVLDQISKTETSARHIKDILLEPVNAQGERASGDGTLPRYQYIDQAITAIGTALAVQLNNTLAIQTITALTIRDIYGARYAQSHSMATRLETLKALDAFPLVSIADYKAEQENVGRQLPATIAALVQSHDRLVEIIADPSSDDRKRAFISGVQNLKTVVQALAATVSAFK